MYAIYYMCGISAILSKNNKTDCIELLMKSLAILQNRGYDSFGSSCIIQKESNNIFSTQKIACTEENVGFDDFKTLHTSLKTTNCIGHTRWATHGNISIENTHPHSSNSSKIMLVHNGIIENYKILKDFLEQKSFTFYSQTDSEVIVNLIDYFYSIEKKTIEESIKQACTMLNGTYGLAIQCIDKPDNIYLLRNGSPLLLGENDNYIIATSEASGFINQVKHYLSLKNGDLAILSKQGIKKSESYQKIKCNDQNLHLTPEPYNFWTEKEIYEQKDSLLRATNNGGRIFNNSIKLGGIESLKNRITDIESVILLGCGTSLHACQIGSFYLKNHKCVNTIEYFDAAEFTERDLPLNDKCLIIMISQSGETMDLHRILNIINSNDKCITMGIINTVDSLIAREVDCGIYLNAGKEIAVASTKSFTNSLLILYMFSLWLYQEKQKTFLKIKYIDSIRHVIENVGLINNNIHSIVDKNYIQLLNSENIFILGKGKMEFIAKEMALKLKEICYIHAEGYSGSALKHGPFALLTKKFPVILLIDNENEQKMMNTYEEIKSRGGEIIVLCENKELNVDNKIIISTNQYLQEILFIVVLQHIAFELAKLRNINPDKPRNLAKVVTVE